MKKLTICIALMATLAFVGNATAATYKINLAGASAQAKFWRTAGAAYLQDLGCSQRSIAEVDEKNGIVQGTGCPFPNAGDSNTVQIAYLAIASYAGCENAPGCGNVEMADPGSCTFSTDFTAPGTCTANSAQPVHLGAADVPCKCLSQTSSGYEDGFCADSDQNDDARFCDTGGATGGADWTSYGPYDNPLPERMTVYRSVAVPFGFIVNDSVQIYTCADPGVAIDEGNIAYDPVGNHCEPNAGFGADGVSDDCVGYADCDKASGTCTNDATKSCTTPEDCPLYDVNDTSCEQRPVQNLSRLKLALIFSNQVDQWTDFGPWYDVVSGYDDLPSSGTYLPPAGAYETNDFIVACMRHAGSGTHATMENVVMRSDATLVKESDGIRFFHYRSSSDLTEDCVQRFPGSIGYVDGDKILHKDDTWNIHTIKYQGVEPSRDTIRTCEYPFFAEQQTFLDPNCVDDDLEDLAAGLDAFAADEANLTSDKFGVRAEFWATQGELKCSKGSTCGGCGLLPSFQ